MRERTLPLCAAAGFSAAAALRKDAAGAAGGAVVVVVGFRGDGAFLLAALASARDVQRRPSYTKRRRASPVTETQGVSRQPGHCLRHRRVRLACSLLSFSS